MALLSVFIIYVVLFRFMIRRTAINLKTLDILEIGPPQIMFSARCVLYLVTVCKLYWYLRLYLSRSTIYLTEALMSCPAIVDTLSFMSAEVTIFFCTKTNRINMITQPDIYHILYVIQHLLVLKYQVMNMQLLKRTGIDIFNDDLMKLCEFKLN